MRGRGGVVVYQCMFPLPHCGALAMAGATKGVWLQLATEVTDRSSHHHNERKRNIQRKDGHERSGRNAPMPAVLEGAGPHAVGGLCHQRGDSRLYAIEETCNDGHVTMGHIQPRQRNDEKEGRQNKKNAGQHTAPGPVQQPAQIGGQLLRFRPGQQHAIVEGVQKALFGDPPAAVNQLLMHEGDLTGRAAKADEPQLQPEA